MFFHYPLLDTHRSRAIFFRILIVLIATFTLAACDYNPLGKDAKRFTLTGDNANPKTIEYVDWRIVPLGADSTTQIPMKSLAINSYVSRADLPPGNYEIRMRKRGAAFTTTQVTIEADKWDYLVDPPTTGASAPKTAIALTGNLRTADGQPYTGRLGVLCAGDEIGLQTVSARDGNFTANMTVPVGNYRVRLIVPGTPPKECDATGGQLLNLNATTNLGNLIAR